MKWTRLVRALAATAALATATTASARAETYRVSDAASAATKTAVAEGREPEHGYPVIESVDGTIPSSLRPGTRIHAIVRTSENVSYVEGRVRYWNVALAHSSNGTFELNYRVPFLPPNALGHWTFDLVARSVDGVEVRRSFPIVYRY